MQPFKYRLPLNTAKLNKRLIFQQKEEVKGQDGDSVSEWIDTFTVWGSLIFLKGREYFQAASTNSEVQGKGEIRFRKDITSDMRIKHNDDIYDIISVIPTENNMLLIMWKRGGMNG